MKKSVLLLITLILTISAFAQVKVRGYYRKNGTYVQPHMRSSPNSNPYDNYSYPGNTNPYTGKVATGNPETYLRNYYNNSSSTGSTSTLSIGVNSTTTPTYGTPTTTYADRIYNAYNTTMPNQAEVDKNNREWEERSRKNYFDSQANKVRTKDYAMELLMNRQTKKYLKNKAGSYTGEYLMMTDMNETVTEYTLYGTDDFPKGKLKVFANGERLLFDNFGHLLKRTKHKK